MDIQEIAKRSQLPVRRIRYALDQRLLPGLRGRLQVDRAGRPRSFTPMEAFFLAAAASLLVGGAQRMIVTDVLARLADLPWPLPGMAPLPRTTRQRALPQPTTALEALFMDSEGPIVLEIGDGTALELAVGPVKTGWFVPRPLARLDAAYQPRVVIRLDLGPLRYEFSRSADGTSKGKPGVASRDRAKPVG